MITDSSTPSYQYDGTTLADVETYDAFIKLILTSFDAEVDRLVLLSDPALKLSNPKSPDDLPAYAQIIKYFSEAFYRYPNYAFFTLPVIQSVTSEVFENDLIRDFVLRLTTTVSLNLIATMEDRRVLVNTVITSVKYSLMPLQPDYSQGTDEVNSQILIPEKDFAPIRHDTTDKHSVLVNSLVHNFWLMVYFLVLTNYHQTAAYRQYANTQIPR